MRLRYKPLVLLTTFIAVLAVSAISFAQTPEIGPKPSPSVDPAVSMVPSQVSNTNPAEGKVDRPVDAPPLGINFSAFSFNDNPTYNGGFYFIPPDPHGAAGPEHVVNVGNAIIQWFTKLGVLQSTMSLAQFFAPLGPPLGTYCFDPKVLYDQYAERFVVVALERTRIAAGDPTDDSYILVAVSKTSDPNAGWWYHAIHSKINISGVDTWADYPGLAVDDNAIFITNNMFTFPGAYASMRLWIVNKNPFYTGGVASVTIHDPYGASGWAGYEGTTMPTHMYGTLPGLLGTYLIASGWTYGGAGGLETNFVIQVDDPVGAPVFTQQWVDCGDISDIGGGFGFPALPDAPQFGTATLVEVNDRRALDAVWRDGQLYACAEISANQAPDIGQTTAHWWRIDTAAGIGGLFTADEGNVGAEDLGVSTYTWFPSVSVDKCGNMAIGFAASNSQIYPGAYYTGRLTVDAPGTVQVPTGVLQAGTDYYYRAFGGTRNRWGDYSGCALDPSDQATFWVYNEHAITRGTIFASLPLEDGRYDTHWGSFTLGCQTVSVAITGFQAKALKGAVEITASFNADFDNFRVNVYRQDDRLEQAMRYKTIEMSGGSDLTFVDRLVEPGKTYRYYIGAVDKDGEFFSPTQEVTIPEVDAALRQNNPNPFNPTTTISFDLPTTQHVSLVIYDAGGRVVKTLIDGVRRFGPNSEVWDGTDDAGNRVGSGVYFYRLESGSFHESRKMVMIK